MSRPDTLMSLVRTLKTASVILAIGGCFIFFQYLINQPENKNKFFIVLLTFYCLLEVYFIYIAYSLLKNISPSGVKHLCASLSFLFFGQLMIWFDKYVNPSSILEGMLSPLWLLSMWLFYRYIAKFLNGMLWPNAIKT
jgi:hypothetical protein